MANSFIPTTDDGLRTWAANLARRVSEDPSYGVPPERAARLTTLSDEFAAAYLVAANLGARCRADVVRKNNLREALKTDARVVVSLVRGQENVSEAQKAALGLTLPSGTRTRVGRPDQAPNVRVVSTFGRTVSLRVSDSQVTRRGRPRGVVGAVVLFRVGPETADNDPRRAGNWAASPSTTS
jgi:hypothetical protein